MTTFNSLFHLDININETTVDVDHDDNDIACVNFGNLA